MSISIIIRTLNESAHLDELLTEIENQVHDEFGVEVIIVDSGSTDATLAIANSHDVRIVHIDRADFSFGRSLNLGCAASIGDILVFISGHCIPVTEHWLSELVLPLDGGTIDYTYGNQLGRDTTKYSEERVFDKYFPEMDLLPQEGFFCNNANAAIKRNTWKKYQFDEELTGLEDMELAKRCVADGGHVGYTSNAAVYHIHDEPWHKVKIRYEREAIALQKIMPEIHVSLYDFLSYVVTSIFSDIKHALSDGRMMSVLPGLIAFRICQYWGGYVGNHSHRKLSAETKRKYFYPNEKVTQSIMKVNDE